MENKERKTEDGFQVSGFGKLMNGGAIIKDKKWKRIIQFGGNDKEFSLDTDFEMIMGQPSRYMWEMVGKRDRFNGRGSFKEECQMHSLERSNRVRHVEIPLDL